MICTTNVSIFNATNPCYLDTTNNRIWIRLPHFSGNKPSVTGCVVTATAAATATDSESGSGSAVFTLPQKIHSWLKITPGTAAIMKDFSPEIGIKEITINVNNEVQNVKVTVTKYDGKPAAVSVEKTGDVYQYIQINTTNLLDKLKNATIQFRVNKTWTVDNDVDKENVIVSKFDESSDGWNELATTYSSEDDDYYYYNVEVSSFSYFAISEKSLVSGEETGTTTAGGEAAPTASNLTWLWIVIGAAVLVAIVVVVMMKRKK